MRAAGSLALAELARTLVPEPEAATALRFDVGTVTALNPFTVSVRGVAVQYARRLHSYQQAAVNDKVYVLMVGPSVLVLGPEWEKDDYAINTTPPAPPPKPPPPPAPSVLVTADYGLTAWNQYRGEPIWGGPSNAHLNYGYSSGFQFRVAWLVNAAAVRAAISGKKVHSVYLRLHNLNTYRGTGTQTVVVQQHTSATLPIGWSAVAGRTPVAIWQFGVPPANQAAWLNITSTVKLATFQGFALPDAGSTDPRSYGIMASPADGDPPILRVNYWS